jgi:hypothetical protein
VALRNKRRKSVNSHKGSDDRKGAIELSMTTIVVAVLGITLLSLGLIFVRGIFTKLSGISEKGFEVGENVIAGMELGDQKLNFPSRLSVKIGDATTSKIRICNVDGTLTGTENAKGKYRITLTPSGDNVWGPGKLELVSPTRDTDQDIDAISQGQCYETPIIISAAPTVTITSPPPTLSITVTKSGNRGTYITQASIISVIK